MTSYKVSIAQDLKDIVPEYIERRKKEIPGLIALSESGNLDALREAGHKLAGSGGGYGFDQLSAFGKKIETLARAGDLPGVTGCLSELVNYLENLEIVYE
jgi:HPt (histidine-containing phosphotransfer) domain-containing protein